MNERIKELVKQAGGHFSTHILTSYPAQRRESIELWDNNIEKFAELIVRECIQNIRDNMEIAKVDTLGDKDLFLETLRKSGHFYITELEQHFGVEE